MKIRDDVLESWVLGRDSFTPKDLVRRFGTVDSTQTATQLMSLVKENIIHQAYKLVLPNGELGKEDFIDPRDIDDFYFEDGVLWDIAAGCDITPIFYANILYRR